MKDAVATMGDLLPDDAGGRDAVHVAVFSAHSTVPLFPSQRVAVVSRGEADAEVSPIGECCGIVDPFLMTAVKPGERCWIYLFPRTITALSHRWSHPAFEESIAFYAPPSAKLTSEQWLRDFCAKSDCPSYEEVMGKASRVADGGSGSNFDDNYLHFNDQDAHGEIPPEFWDHVAAVLGRPILGSKPTYFSCAC